MRNRKHGVRKQHSRSSIFHYFLHFFAIFGLRFVTMYFAERTKAFILLERTFLQAIFGKFRQSLTFGTNVLSPYPFFLSFRFMIALTVNPHHCGDKPFSASQCLYSFSTFAILNTSLFISVGLTIRCRTCMHQLESANIFT